MSDSSTQRKTDLERIGDALERIADSLAQIAANTAKAAGPPNPFEGVTPDLLDTPIDELGLTTRARRALFHGGFRTVAELLPHTAESLLEAVPKGFGKKSVDDLRMTLAKMGLRLRGDKGPGLAPESV